MLSYLDLSLAFRLLVKDRIFFATILTALSLGIGSFTAIIEIYHTAFFAPLPFDDYDKLARVYIKDHSGRERNPNLKEFFQLREATQSLEDLAAFSPEELVVIGAERTEAITALSVTPEFFQLFGRRALKGRFLHQFDFPGQSSPAVISFDLWRRVLGGSEPIVGSIVPVRSLNISRPGTPSLSSLVVVGVMPPTSGMDRVPDPQSRFFNLEQTREERRAEIWLPMELPRVLTSRRPVVMARVKTSLAAAQTEVDSRFDGSNGQTAVGLISLRESMMGENGRRLLNIFLVAGGFVLLTCVLNAANLFAAHLFKNRDQNAILMALGASSFRLGQVLFAQNLFLSVSAGMIGVGLARGGLAVLRRFPTSAVPRLEAVGLHLEVWLLALLLSVLLGSLICGFLCMRLSRIAVASVLRTGTNVRGDQPGWLPRGALVLQIAFTLTLLITSAILLQSFVKLLSVNTGFRVSNIAVFKVPFRYELVSSREPLARHQLKVGQILEYISSLPGIDLAATGSVPMRDIIGGGVYVEGGQEMTPVLISPVSADFFQLLEIPILEGAGFGLHNPGQADRKVVVVNQSLAERLWNGESAVGKRLRFNLARDEWLTVVGVVQDIRRLGLDMQPPAEIYLPFLQSGGYADCQFLVRTHTDPRVLVPAIRQALRSFDRSLALAEIQSLSEVISNSTSHRRLVLWLVATFAVISLLVSCVGVYGVVATYASRRRPELGLRIAVGATRASIVRLCVVHGLRPIVVGGILGMGGALLLAQKTTYLLYETSPTDPATYLGVLLLLAATATLASLVPAVRAAQVDAHELLKLE